MKYQAVISTFIPNRKFGFLKLEDGSTVFFHVTNFLEGVPALGQRVEFELGDSVKLGMPKQAVNISIVNETFDALAGSATASTEVSK